MPLSRRTAPETVQESRQGSQWLAAALDFYFDHINPGGQLSDQFPVAVRAMPALPYRSEMDSADFASPCNPEIWRNDHNDAWSLRDS